MRLTQARPKLTLRHMTPTVMDSSLAESLDRDAFAQSWGRNVILAHLQERHSVGRLALLGRIAVGYTLFACRRTRIELFRLAVHPDYLRRGIGRALIADLVATLPGTPREGIGLYCRDGNLAGQCFYRSLGFRAIPPVIRGFYHDTGEDAYRFVYRRDQPAPAIEPPPVGPAYHVEGMAPGTPSDGPGCPWERSRGPDW